MNPTGDAPQTTQEFVLLRFQQPFLTTIGNLFGLPETWLLVPLVALLVLSIAATVFTAGWVRNHRARAKAGKGPRLDPTGSWLKFATAGLWFLTVVCVLVILFRNDTFTSASGGGPGTNGSVAGQSDRLLWSVLTGGVFALGAAYTVAMYVRDARGVAWYWAAGLAALRITVYGILCVAFLLPAVQTFDQTEKHSRVVVLIDVSESVTEKSDEVGGSVGRRPKPRIAAVIDLLTDDKVAFLKKLLDKNPVVVYRFGNRLDDDPQVFGRGDPAWSARAWEEFTRYDFKPFLLKGLSDGGRDAVVNSRAWEGNRPGTPEWAEGYFKLPPDDVTPAGLSDADAKAFRANWDRLSKRIDLARSIAKGTNVPDAVTAAVNRESGNMVQGIVVVSDGRSNLGGSTGFRDLKARAAKEKVPLFTVAVGEDRETIGIEIASIQAPDSTPPDEPFKLIVGADGVNLANQPAQVSVDLYLPGKHPKTDQPDATLSQTLPFPPGDPPHLEAEFVIDPEKAPEALVEVKDGKKVLKAGPWSVRARIPRDPRESFAEPEHVLDRPQFPPGKGASAQDEGPILVQQRPTRILLVSSTPSHEYQKVRDLFLRETIEKRAELSILLQAPLENVRDDPADPAETKRRQKAALKGIVQDVDENHLLVRFPDRLTVGNVENPEQDWEAKDPDYAYYNLNYYDLIIAIDADWSKTTKEGAANLKEWVQRQGGGLVFVAGPMKTDQLARVELEPGGKNNHLVPILEVLPVVPEDVVELHRRSTPKAPRRLFLTPPPGSDLLKLDEAVKGDPIAGWEQYFTDRESFVQLDDPLRNLSPRRGFFSVYPVKTKNSPNKTLIDPTRGGFEVKENGLKPRAALLAEFAYAEEKNGRFEREVREPWLVVLDPVGGRGRSAYVGSGETYRMFGFERDYFDRFWVKLAKYMVGTRNFKSLRGRVLLTKTVTEGTPIRVQVQLLDERSRPYPVARPGPRFRVVQVTPTGELAPVGVYPTVARKGGGEFDGYYTGQVYADPKQFREDATYKVLVDVPDSPGEPPLSREFRVVKSNPEKDNYRPDFGALLALASDLDKDFEARIAVEASKKTLQEKLPKLDGATKLAFRVGQKDLVGLIPDCMTAQEKRDKVLGKTDDLWDRGFAMPRWLTGWAFDAPQTLSYVLLVVVGLLSVEWLTRKLLRLA